MKIKQYLVYLVKVLMAITIALTLVSCTNEKEDEKITESAVESITEEKETTKKPISEGTESTKESIKAKTTTSTTTTKIKTIKTSTSAKSTTTRATATTKSPVTTKKAEETVKPITTTKNVNKTTKPVTTTKIVEKDGKIYLLTEDGRWSLIYEMTTLTTSSAIASTQSTKPSQIEKTAKSLEYTSFGLSASNNVTLEFDASGWNGGVKSGKFNAQIKTNDVKASSVVGRVVGIQNSDGYFSVVIPVEDLITEEVTSINITIPYGAVNSRKDDQTSKAYTATIAVN